MTSDKLFFSLFQSSPDLILRWLRDLPADAGGYRFSAPVLKQREYRLDGLFSPPEQRTDLPAVILEAQMAADPGFLLRLYAETARFLQQESWQRDWRVVVICPHRQLNFGVNTPVQEFLEHRVIWIELQPETKVLAVANDLRLQATTNPLAAEVLPLIPAILLSRFNNRPIKEICAMGGITIEDFTKSPAYREIFGEGEALGEAKVTLRQLNRRCGPLSESTSNRIKALPLERLEALSEALLDFTSPADLTAWLLSQAATGETRT